MEVLVAVEVEEHEDLLSRPTSLILISISLSLSLKICFSSIEPEKKNTQNLSFAVEREEEREERKQKEEEEAEDLLLSTASCWWVAGARRRRRRVVERFEKHIFLFFSFENARSNACLSLVVSEKAKPIGEFRIRRKQENPIKNNPFSNFTI